MQIIERDEPLPPKERPPWGMILVSALLVLVVALYTAKNPSWAAEYGPTFLSLALTALVAVGILVIYFLPWMIGLRRDISTAGPLFLVNLIFGWTLIGWLMCLIWAAVGATRAQDEYYRKQAGTK